MIVTFSSTSLLLSFLLKRRAIMPMLNSEPYLKMISAGMDSNKPVDRARDPRQVRGAYRTDPLSSTAKNK